MGLVTSKIKLSRGKKAMGAAKNARQFIVEASIMYQQIDIKYRQIVNKKSVNYKRND